LTKATTYLCRDHASARLLHPERPINMLRG
jgi:hypothetical protein